MKGLIVVVTAALVGLVGCARNPDVSAKAETKPRVVPVTVLPVEPSEFVELGIYYGKLEGETEAILVSVLGGRVDRLDVAEGAEVEAGDSLGMVNAEKAKSRHELALVNERVARSALERQKKFLEDGNTSQVNVDQAELAWLAARDSLIDAKRALEGALCVTPIQGVVLKRHVDLYDELVPGSPTFSVARLDRMRVKVGIPEQEISGVAVGNRAELTSTMADGRVWNGTVTRLSRKVSEPHLTFEAEISVANPGRVLLPGATVRVGLRRRVMADRIVVPSEAILAEGDDNYVMVEKEGIARRLPVVLGPANRSQTVVLEGLNAGASLIIGGNHLLTDGAEVEVKARVDS